jgi:hypothetical protein
MMYGAEYRATKGQHIQKMSAAELRMLCWICGYTRRDRIRNDDIQNKFEVTQIQEKLIQHHLRWFDHIQWMPHKAPICSGILSHPENVRIKRCRPRLTWKETIKKDLKKWNIFKEIALDMSAWKTVIHVSEP